MGTGINALGEQQVNFSINGSSGGVVGTQADPAVAALANGDFVVVYENPHSGDSLLAHFFDANGNAIGPPVSSGLLNGVVGIDPAAQVGVQPAVAATADGGFLVAYTDTSVTATNKATNVTFEANGIDVRRYDNTTGLSSPFVIDTGGGALHQPNVGTVGDAAIAAFADGASLVAWDFDFNADKTDDDVYFAFLNSSANGFTTINGTAHDQRPLTIANGFEGEPSVATTGNLGAIVYADDPGHKQGDQDITLVAFNSSGTQLVPPTTLFGASSLDVFSHPDVAALSDGRFVIVARDDTTSALVACIFDPVTRAVTPLNLPLELTAPFVGAGTDPHVAGLPGGGFILTSEDSTGNVTETRFGPGGSLAILQLLYVRRPRSERGRRQCERNSFHCLAGCGSKQSELDRCRHPHRRPSIPRASACPAGLQRRPPLRPAVAEFKRSGLGLGDEWEHFNRRRAGQP